MIAKIIFPPFAEHALHGPHLAPFLLCSILNKSGINSVGYDFNIKLIRRILCKDVVLHAIAILEKSENQNQDEIFFLNSFLSVPISLFAKYSSEGLIRILQILKKVLFSSPQTLEECLELSFARTDFICRLYEEMLLESEVEKADIVGISIAFAEQLPEAVIISRILKTINPSVKIIAGGSQLNLLDAKQLQSIKSKNIFHCLFIGDAESMISIVISDPDKYFTNGIIYGKQTSLKIINEIPRAEFTDIELYFAPIIIPVLATKGCFWGKCTFCDYILLSEAGEKKYLARSVNKVIDEMKYYQERYNPTDFFLISDAVPPVWFKQLCELAIVNKFKIKSWSYMLHSEQLSPDYFSLLSDAGVRVITFGTESTNNRVLKLMNKKCNKEIILQNIKDATANHLKIIVNVIPDFPSVTFAEAMETYYDIKTYSSCISSLNVQPFTLTSDTYLSKHPEEFGIEITDDTKIKTRHGFHSQNYIQKQGMNEHERAEMADLFFALSIEIKRRNLTASLLKKDFNPDSILYFDPAVVLINKEVPEIYIFNLKSKIQIKKWEFSVYQKVFSNPEKNILFSDFKKLVYEYFPTEEKINFISYFYNILGSGLIVKSE